MLRNNLCLHATWQKLYNYLELQQDVNSGMKRAAVTLASFPGLLTTAFDTCSTNMRVGLVKLITCNDYLDIAIGWMCGGVHIPRITASML